MAGAGLSSSGTAVAPVAPVALAPPSFFFGMITARTRPSRLWGDASLADCTLKYSVFES